VAAWLEDPNGQFASPSRGTLTNKRVPKPKKMCALTFQSYYTRYTHNPQLTNLL